MRLTSEKNKGWILLIVGAMLATRVGMNVVRLWKAGERVEEARVQLEDAQKKNAELKAKLEEVKTPEFVEREAREKLGLGKPGEEVVVVSGSESKASTGVIDTKTEEANWKKWWNLYVRL